MAEQHVRAVQKRRGEFEPTDFQIILAIATDMGRKGEPARTSQRELANRSGCHYNTAGTRLKRLVDRGIVSAIKNGRQHHHGLPFVTDNHNTPEAIGDDSHNSSQFVTVTDYHNFKAEVCDNLKKLENKIDALTEQLSQLSQQIATIHQRVIVMEDKEKDKSKNTPQPPQGDNAAQANGNGRRRKTPLLLIIPESLNTPEFLAEWERWKVYRKAKDSTYQGQLDKLAKEPVAFAIARLERTRLNGWTGLWFSDEKPLLVNGQTAEQYRKGNGTNENGNGKDYLWGDFLDYINGKKPFAKLHPLVQESIRQQTESSVKRQPTGVTKSQFDKFLASRH